MCGAVITLVCVSLSPGSLTTSHLVGVNRALVWRQERLSIHFSVVVWEFYRPFDSQYANVALDQRLLHAPTITIP